MRRSLAALALLGAAPAAWGAVAQSRLAHPRGAYTLDFPADWKQTPGREAVVLRPAGRAGAEGRVMLERHPLGRRSPKTAEDYVLALLEPVGTVKVLQADEKALVDGRPARRLLLSQARPLKGPRGEELPGPLREAVVVVGVGKAYYVIRLEAIGTAFDALLPQFDAVVKSLRFKT